MNIERVARTLVGAAALCGLFGIAGCNNALTSNSSGAPPGGTPVASAQVHGDWGMSMLATGTVGVGMFPAKFNWDVNAAPSCTNDYVAFNTTLAGASPTTAASQTATFPNANNTPTGTVTITHGATSLVLTGSTTLNGGLNFLVVNNSAPGNTANATSLAAAINSAGNGSSVGVSATTAANVVTIHASNNGSEGNSITLATGINGARFTLGGAALAGGVGTGNIVALNHLYATQGSVGGLCAQNGPSVYWSYFTGTGTTVTSIVLSGDGSKVAFVENVGTNATLHILKWNAGEGTATGYPVAPTNTLAAGMNWSTCPAGSCMRSIAFSGGPATDTKSSPFYVYANNADVIYAGDNSGRVHKFTGVFNGAPAEAGAPWPITVNAGATLTSPIYDSGSGNIFVGDSTGRLSFIREVGSNAGTCTPQPCLDATNLHVGGAGGSIDDAPIVDGTTGLVIATNSNDGTNFGSILQASTALVTSAGSPFKIGGSVAGSAIYSGAFDNAYITNALPATTRHMYVCGKDAANADQPAMYQLSFTAAGVLSGVGTPLVSMANTNGEACSPVTEFFNSTAATDWIFFSIGNNLNPGVANPLTGCRTGGIGCVASVNVSVGQTWPPAAAANSVQTPLNATGATSGFVVDNVSASAQNSNIYFSLGTNSTGAGPGLPSCNTTAGVGCAVKLTQSALN